MQLHLVRKKPESGDVMSFLWQPAETMTWQAGQYLDYHLPHPNPDQEGVDRSFTIASAPADKLIQLTTHITKSSFKQALNSLPIGGMIEADLPDGDFVVKNPVEPMVFLAGGIGITPFRAILRDLASKQQTSADITLLYGNRTSDIVFQSELEQLRAELPGLKIHYLVSPDKIEPATIQQLVPIIDKPRFFVSGPEPMVEAVLGMLDEFGVPTAQQERDDFPGYDWPKAG